MTLVYTINNSLTPAMDYYPVTPSDTVDLPNGPCRGLNCTAAGTVYVDSPVSGGATNTPLAVVAGNNSIAAKRVRTGSSAGTITALY